MKTKVSIISGVRLTWPGNSEGFRVFGGLQLSTNWNARGGEGAEKYEIENIGFYMLDIVYIYTHVWLCRVIRKCMLLFQKNPDIKIGEKMYHTFWITRN